jgi:2-oxoglutarate/2-oxoacid ferredoxin oxidoreductase subunit beta
MKSYLDMKGCDVAWCPGCGNYNILKILKEALYDLKIKPENLVLTSGIGQAAKAPQYLKCNYFNGLHGRALSPATGIKAVNPKLTVVVTSGDGDVYGEGGNHFIHTVRRNPNITNLVHNNMIYGLTKGQASPTSLVGMKTPVQVSGVSEEPFNPLAVAIALDCSFVARINSGDIKQSKEIIKKALKHKGYALIDIFQPCPVFNKLNSFEWFKKNSYYLKGHDVTNKEKAFKKALEVGKYPLGIFYVNKKKKTFEENMGCTSEFYKKKLNVNKLKKVINSIV